MLRHDARRCLLGLMGLGLGIAGCGDDGGYGATVTTGSGGTTGVSSAGTNGEEGGGSPTTGGSGPPPEVEDEGDFRVPKASGKYVYTASKTTDSVAVIDTATLAIDVVVVGRAPAVVEAPRWPASCARLERDHPRSPCALAEDVASRRCRVIRGVV